MKISKRQLKRIIREEYSRLKRKGLIRESMAQQDILYLGNLLGSYKGTFFDWSEFCEWYDDLMMELRVQYGEEMDDFLYVFELDECEENIRDLLSMINRPEVQAHPMFSTWANALRYNF